MIVKFGDETFDSLKYVLNALAGYTVTAEYSEGVVGFPADCSIVEANDNDLIICDVNGAGSPMTNSLYHVGYDEIVSVTIL
jgi:hypothetical protein